MRSKSLRRANVKWFSNKQKPKGKHARSTPMQRVTFRLKDLAQIFRHRYGIELPNDDSGRDDLEIAINHLASLARPRRRIANWIELWAPWLPAGEQKTMVGAALANPQYWDADTLAWRLRLTKKDRTMLGVTTIGSIDENKTARTKRRRKLDRERKAKARRAKGAPLRKVYEANSIAQAMPWIDEGISRATWYRRRKDRETT
jgi:hypothetical protein